jgi:hypothetical protein
MIFAVIIECMYELMRDYPKWQFTIYDTELPRKLTARYRGVTLSAYRSDSLRRKLELVAPVIESSLWPTN